MPTWLTGALLAVWISRSATVPPRNIHRSPVRVASTASSRETVLDSVRAMAPVCRTRRRRRRPLSTGAPTAYRERVRTRRKRRGLTVQAVAGTHTVLLGFDLDDPAGCLGFAIHRTDHTENEARWLRGMKTFESARARPTPGVGLAHQRAPGAGLPVGRLRRQARARLHVCRVGRQGVGTGAGAERDRVAAGAHRGGGRRRARGVVQPRRGGVAGLLPPVRGMGADLDARRDAPGDGVAVARARRGAARLRR